MKANIFLTEPATELQKKRFHAILKDIKAEKVNVVLLEGDLESAAETAVKDAEDLCIFFGNEEGRYLALNTAAKQNVKCFTDVTGITDGRVHRKVYSTHADGYFKLSKKKNIVVLLPAGPVAESESDYFNNPRVITGEAKGEKPEVISVTAKPDAGKLADADLVFVGGRGLKKKENFELLLKAAEKYGASAGCTRAAALAGWSDYSRVVGVSGSQIRPKVCVLFGVSGAAPFLFGIENAETVIAINKDRMASVFDAADYGIVKDCIPFIKELVEGE